MRIALYIACLVFSGFAFGQQLTAHWSVDSCEIGEQVQLKIQLRRAPKKVLYKPYSAEVPCEMPLDSSSLMQDGTLEIIGGFSESRSKKNGLQVWEGTYTLTAWDTGVYIFPLIQIPVNDSIYSFQPKPLTVSFVKKKVNEDIAEVPVEVFTDSWWWLKAYWWLIFIPLAIIAVLIIRKRNNKPVVRIMTLQERTRIGLDALRKEAYWKRGKINEHYIEFSFLLRSFLSARYELNLMERTTYEALLLLRTKNIPEPTLERIRRLLQESDFVKFAMGVPDEESIILGMNYFEQLIVELSPLELTQ